MAYDIGAKIGIAGWQEFRKQINEINKNYKSLSDYSAALSKKMDAEGKSVEALTKKKEVQERQMSLLTKKQEEVTKALEKAKAKYSENSTAVMRLEGALLDVNSAISGMEAEIAGTESELQKLADGIEDVGKEAGSAKTEIYDFGDILKANLAADAIWDAAKEIGRALVEIGKDAIEAASDVRAAEAQFSQTFGDLEGEANRALKSISKDTGIAATRMQGAYTALYAFTKSVGGDSTTALNIAQRAMNAAADSAAYYDRSIEDATETLQSFLKGNYENDAALGIAATETTRNAKANEMYAKSFKDLSEAQKVDVLLAMVEAGNRASGALGQAAREADAWANVTGEAAEATRMLMAALGDPILTAITPLVQGYTAALKGLTEVSAFRELTDSMDSFREGLAAAKAELEQSNTSMAATASLADRYVKKLKTLEAAGLETADAQREYAQAVELLNELMPELGLTIDDATGRLRQNTDAIEANIESLRAQAEQQAKNAYYKTVIDQYAKAYEAQYAAQRRLLQLQQEEQALLEAGAEDKLEYLEITLEGVAGTQMLSTELSEEDKALAANRSEQRALEKQLGLVNEELADAEGLLAEATEGYEGLEKGTKGVTDATDPLKEALTDLGTSYEEARLAARESIDSQIGLFDDLGGKSDWTAKKIIENWERQQRAFANYSANLQKAVDMGLDEALVRQLSDGSKESMQILDAMVNDANISVDEINAAFRRTEEAKNAFTDNVGKMHAVASDEFKLMSKYAEAAGVDLVDGAIAGIDKNIDRYVQALKRMASRGQRGYNEQWTIQSPSKWMRQASDYIVDGGVMQVEDRIGDMERAMQRLAKAGQTAYMQEQLSAANDYPAMIAGAPGYATTTTTNNRHVAYGGISININTQEGQDPRAIVDAVIVELTARLGREEAAFG